MAIDDLKTMLIERRDELETELATIGAMLEVLSPEKSRRQTRPATEKQKPLKGQRRRHKPSERVRGLILDYFKNNPGPARTLAVAKGIGISVGSTGKSLKVMAEDGDIEHAGRDEGAKGLVPLYQARDQGPEHESRRNQPDASFAQAGIQRDSETIERLDEYPSG